MKGNVWLAGYIVVSLLAIAAAGFYAIKEYSTYQGKFGDWNSRSSKIARLEKEKPTPSEENEGQFERELEVYEAKVAALFESLNQFQKPLNTQLDQTQFPNILKQKVDDFRKLARENKIDITKLEKPDPFFMAMDQYRETLPKQENTPLLAYQLGGIERVLNHLVTSEIGKIEELTRRDLPGEGNADSNSPPPMGAADVVQKYPVTLKFEGTHAAFRDFLNRLANDKEYFFVLRVLAVQNSAPDGPDFSGDPSVVGYADEDGRPVTKEEIAAVTEGKTGAELQAAIDAEGWTPMRQDAAILFGLETVKVVAVIDLVRFLSPEEVEAASEADDDTNQAAAGGPETLSSTNPEI